MQELTTERLLEAIATASHRCMDEANQEMAQGRTLAAENAVAGGETLRVLWQEIRKAIGDEQRGRAG